MKHFALGNGHRIHRFSPPEAGVIVAHHLFANRLLTRLRYIVKVSAAEAVGNRISPLELTLPSSLLIT